MLYSFIQSMLLLDHYFYSFLSQLMSFKYNLYTIFLIIIIDINNFHNIEKLYPEVRLIYIFFPRLSLDVIFFTKTELIFCYVFLLISEFFYYIIFVNILEACVILLIIPHTF